MGSPLGCPGAVVLERITYWNYLNSWPLGTALRNVAVEKDLA